MGDVINFAKARARRQREQKKAQAPANRAKHGLTKDARAAEKAAQEGAAREHEEHALPPDTDEPPRDD